MFIYISPSNINNKVANTIQTLNMRKSFEKILETFTINQSDINEENQKNILIKKFSKGFINNIYFSIRVIIKCKKKKKLSNLSNIIYSRSELITLLTYTFGYKLNLLEIHDLRKFSLSYLILFALKFTETLYICINENIKKDLIDIGVKKDNIFVLSDGHGNKTNNISESLDRYKKMIKKKKKLKIGYFGKLSIEKGSEVLKSLILKYHQIIDFHIYALNSNNLKDFPCILDQVNHEKVFSEMKKMDMLLYVANLDKKNTHSRYTSPLKIYEYISSLRPILYMPAGDLTKELKSTITMPFNNSEDFFESLNKLLSLNNPIELIKKTYELSLDKTWDKRAEKVKKIISKKFRIDLKFHEI